ncbi:Delta(6)-protoilludene synthase [Cytospora mali]|uniref:Terpene synthase n=1 Tax=Cytospora mali TaxID=578113 RepID=A0A194VAU3_CYTMA|nr:Delta(6)-protoilludene synthase [Valsa mali var. pyri (nom. inval.)]
MAQVVFLPDFQGSWKWPRQIHPHFEEIGQESSQWAASFGAFTPKAQEAIDKCNLALLAGLFYPWVTKGKQSLGSPDANDMGQGLLNPSGTDQLRCSNDLNHIFFIFDEHSDKWDPGEVRSQADVIMDALRDPEKPRPEGEWVGGEITRQFWARTKVISTPTFQKRLIDAMEEYLHGTAQQAEDRHRSYIRDIEGYFQIRRKTVGVFPSFNMLEMDMNIPDEVRGNPVIQEIETLGVDLCIIANAKQASGDDQHNIITIVMREKAMDVQQAIDWTAQVHAGMTERFNQLFLQIPRWGGPLDWEVQTFMDGVAHLVGANTQWSYETQRYLGKHGLEVQATRMLRLAPKKCVMGEEIGPIILDDTMLK